jgi:adenylosuccinate lyase
MIVHPIDYRYGTEQMKRIWSEDSKIKRMIRVEVALLKALARMGYVDETETEEVKKKVLGITPDRVREIENEIKHDIMALVKAITEVAGNSGRFVHFGATSNDIIDTATALQLRDSLKLLEVRIKEVIRHLVRLAEEHRNAVCLGRTHGQAALPTTYGFRFALWASEMGRHYERLKEMEKRILVGQMSGAVGTQAAFGKDGLEIEREVMRILGLKPATISSQIIPRDIYIEYVSFLAAIASTLEKIATNIRLLQRAETAELMEKFEEKQVGSSTMPHKRNPIDSEQICGIARVIRGFVEPMHQSSILWEERDLTNSSAERIILVETSVLTDHILVKMAKVLSTLRLNYENIKRNLEAQKGLNLSETVMIALTKKGIPRQEAHEILRQASLRAYEKNTSLLEALKSDERISKYFSREELESLLQPENYLGTTHERIDAVIAWLRELIDDL